MKKSKIEKQVRKLARKKKFEQIYDEYGIKYFRKYVSNKYKNQDVEKLREEGEYLEIYKKYGIADSKAYLEKEEEKREKKKSIKSLIRIQIFSWASMFTAITLGPAINTDLKIKENSEKYEKEIQEYEKTIKEYANKFDVDKQSDMEIIMRTMKDLHETILGYGEPKIDATGYLGMDVIDEEGIGVCRNFADNIADKLNEINPEYNARVITLYQESANYIRGNIENTIINEDGTIIKCNGNVKEKYVDNKLERKTISQEDGTVIYDDYENGKMVKRTIKTSAKEKTEIEYDEEGKVLRGIRTITEENDNKKTTKIYVDGCLYTYREQTEEYYISKNYNENGKLYSETVADEDKEKTTFYDDGNINFVTILKDGYKTTIHYDEYGKELSKEKEETEENNIFVALKEAEELEEKKENIEKEKKEYKISNHAIVAVDIDSDNVTLLIDPTNIGIGVYKDAKIIMFNEQDADNATCIKSFIGDIVYGGTEGMIKYPIDYIKSFRESALSIQELEEKYGLEAQNKMLKKIEEQDNEKTFKEELKIAKGVTYNFEENVVTIDKSEIEKQEENQK